MKEGPILRPHGAYRDLEAYKLPESFTMQPSSSAIGW